VKKPGKCNSNWERALLKSGQAGGRRTRARKWCHFRFRLIFSHSLSISFSWKRFCAL